MKTRVFWILAVSVVGLAAGASMGLTQGSNPLDPLRACPDTHRLLFENAYVRVIESKVPPGKQEPRHSHPHGVTVYLADYEVETKTIPDNKVTRSPRRFGSVTWSEAVVHEVRNVGSTASHAVRIELK
jgi:quercetin dioxygenase-like cupin family protein